MIVMKPNHRIIYEKYGLVELASKDEIFQFFNALIPV